MMAGKIMDGKNSISIVMTMALVFLMAGTGICMAATGSTTLVSHDTSSLLLLSLVSQSPDPAMTGDTVDLKFGVENMGGVSAQNVVLEIVPQYPFEPVSGNDTMVSVGTINPYQADTDMRIAKATLKIDPQAVGGTYTLKVLIYEAGRQSEFSAEKTFQISVGSQDSAVVSSIDRTEIVPGEQTPITFTVSNTGSSPLRNVLFSWSSSGDTILPVGSDNTKYIDYLGVGKSEALSYNVTADASSDASLCKLNLSIRYEDPITGSVKTTSTVAGIYVGGGTDFDVLYSESSSGQVSLSVANVGSNPAYSVSVLIPQQNGWRTTGSNSVIIGNLNKGDYTIASFTLAQTGSGTVAGNRTGPANGNWTGAVNRTGVASAANLGILTVDVEYTDTRGQRKVVESNVSLSGMAAANSSFSGFSGGNGSSRNYQNGRGGMGGLNGLTQGMDGVVTIVEWAVGVIIILAIAYFLYRRHNAKKKASARKNVLDEDFEKPAGGKSRK